MPFLPASSPWLKKYLLGALAQSPAVPSLHASYLLVISPVTSRRTLCCYDGQHCVRVVLSQSAASTLDADEEDTGVTTRNLVGYVLAPVQVAVLTDMTTSPPSATLLLKQARVFSDRRHQRPAGIVQNVDRDADVVEALRANIGQELAALREIPNKQKEFQTEADFLAAFENMERGAPPFPPSDALLSAGSFGLSVEDEAAPDNKHPILTNFATADDGDLALDAQDLELLEPDVLPLFSNTPTPPSARNSQGSRTVGLEKPPQTRKGPQSREPFSSRNADLDHHPALAGIDDDPILSPSPPQNSGNQVSARDLGRPLAQPLPENDSIHDDGASTASKPSLDQELEPRMVELTQRVVSETPEEDKDGNCTKSQKEQPAAEKNEEISAILDGLSYDEMAGDESLQLSSKQPNNHQKGRANISTKRDQACTGPVSRQLLPCDAMVTRRTTRATGKVLSSDKELEQETQQHPEADDSSPVPEQEAEQQAEKDASSDERDRKEIEHEIEKNQSAKSSTRDNAKSGSDKQFQAKVEKDDAEHGGDVEQTAERPDVVQMEEEEGEEKIEGVKEIPTSDSRKEAIERRKTKPTDVMVMVKDSDDEDEEEIQPVEGVQKKDETKGDEGAEQAPSDKEELETTPTHRGKKGGVTAAEDQQADDEDSASPLETGPGGEGRTTESAAHSSPMDDGEEEGDRTATKVAKVTNTKNGTKRKAGKSDNVKQNEKRKRDDFYVEKLETELKAIREFRMRADRNPDMFVLNPNGFLPGPLRRSVDRSLPSMPAPKLPDEDHFAAKSAPM